MTIDRTGQVWSFRGSVELIVKPAIERKGMASHRTLCLLTGRPLLAYETPEMSLEQQCDYERLA